MHAIILLFFVSGAWSASWTSNTQITDPAIPYLGAFWATWKDMENQRIHFIGGYTEEPNIEYSSKYAFYFDVTTQTFVTEPQTSQALQTAAVHDSVQVGSYIYYQNRDGNGDGVGRYNVETGAFNYPLSPGPPVSNPGSCLATDGRFVFMVGAEYNAGLQVYDTELLQWLPSGPGMSHRHRGGAACQAVNGVLYAFGGLDTGYDSDFLNVIEKIVIGVGDEVWTNLASNSWTVLPATLNIGRGWFSSVRCDKVDQNLLYLIGGAKGTEGNWQTEWSIEVFDFDTETVSLLADTTRSARADATAVCFRNRVYIFGGCTVSSAGGPATPAEWQCPKYLTWEISNELFALTPTTSPTQEPSRSPVSAPTGSPSQPPTSAPSFSPSRAPTGSPSQPPTAAPSFSPSSAPSFSPSRAPTGSPSQPPTSAPSNIPIQSPTGVPSRFPSRSPGAVATRRPTPSRPTNATDESGPGNANSAASASPIALALCAVMAYLMK